MRKQVIYEFYISLSFYHNSIIWALYTWLRPVRLVTSPIIIMDIECWGMWRIGELLRSCSRPTDHRRCQIGSDQCDSLSTGPLKSPGKGCCERGTIGVSTSKCLARPSPPSTILTFIKASSGLHLSNGRSNLLPVVSVNPLQLIVCFIVYEVQPFGKVISQYHYQFKCTVSSRK